MNSQVTLLDQMQKLALLLVENANSLCQLVREVSDENSLEALQLRQHELLGELAIADSLLKKCVAHDTSSEDKAVILKKAEFQAQLELFQQTNKRFFELLNIRFRVIQPP
jgi:hypothetical protein